MNKILICCPVSSLKQYSFNIWLEFLANQDYKDFDYAVCCNGKDKEKLCELMDKVYIKNINWKEKKKLKVLNLLYDEKLSMMERITFSREVLRRYANENNYKGLLWLDSDTIPVNLNAVSLLVKSKKEAVSGVYFYKNSSVPIVIGKKTGTNIKLDYLKDMYEDKKIFEILACGYGCIYHTKRALNVAFDFSKMKYGKNDDIGHCQLLTKNKIKIYCNPLVFCKHIRQNSNPCGVKNSNKLLGGEIVKKKFF
jgi:hypothetical protein